MDKPTSHDGAFPKSFIIMIVAVTLTCVGWGAFTAYVVLTKDGNIGIFGDAFGALNAIFSGLAFALFWYTISLQRKDLTLQREALSLARDEMVGQKEQLRIQAEQLTLQSSAMSMQNFEASFFSMMSLHNEIVASMSNGTHTGRRVFPELLDVLRSHMRECACANGSCSHSIDELNSCYEEFSSEHSYLNHYFRNLYNIVKFVKNSSVPDKRMYTNIVRAQLSSAELALLFYNCLSDRGREKFKPLLEEFSFLNEMDDSMILSEEHKKFYDPAAFDSNLARQRYA